MVSTLEQMQVPNRTGPGVRRSKRPLLASRTRCNVLLINLKIKKKLFLSQNTCNEKNIKLSSVINDENHSLTT